MRNNNIGGKRSTREKDGKGLGKYPFQKCLFGQIQNKLKKVHSWANISSNQILLTIIIMQYIAKLVEK